MFYTDDAERDFLMQDMEQSTAVCIQILSPLYEIRRAGVTLCESTVPNLGYSRETLRDMDRSGLHLYCNGKREKAASRGANTESGRPK